MALVSSNPMDWACGTCAQQPGEACIGMPPGEFHASRVEAAHTYTSGRGNTPTVVEFDNAIEESGEV